MPKQKYHVFGRFYDGSGQGSGFLGSFNHPSRCLPEHRYFDILETYVIDNDGDLSLYCIMTESSWNDDAEWRLMDEEEAT